jgi:hypothetical protein
LLICLAVASMAAPGDAYAQFMRIGPFDLEADTSLDAIYTTNVDGQKESESMQERTDYYLLWSFNMNLTGPSTPTSELNLDTAMSIEKHFVRDDLDTSSDPFGNIDFTHDLELGRFQLPTTINLRRENTQDDDGTTRIFIPGQRTERIVQDSRGITQGVLWRRDPFGFNLDYAYNQTRFLEPEYQEGDEDDQSLAFGITWDVFRWGGQQRMNLFYNYDQSKTDLINQPGGEGSGEWEKSQSFGLTLQILTRPNFSYSLAYAQDDGADWRYTHTFSLQDAWEISPTMLLDASANYTIDEQPRIDDIAFTYNVGFAHEVGETLRHSLTMAREPVNTFGSTADTDSTTWSYNLTKTDLFFANLAFDFSISHSIDKPQGPEAGPTETSTTYTAGLSHSVALSRRLNRNIDYLYSYETDNLSDEPIEEHRITLGLAFTF